MFQYNLLDNECSDIFDLAQEKAVGCLIGGPLKRGYLSGQFEKPNDLPLDDNYWKWNLNYSRPKVEETLCKASKLKQQAGSARELRKKALHHIFKHPAATVAIVGHRTEEEVTDNAKAIGEIFA